MCCKNCDAVYIGETGWLLEDRTDEHRKDVVKSKVTSNVYLHVLSTGHSFNFNDASVIRKSNNVRIRRKLEGIHSLKTLNTFNRAWEVHPVYTLVVCCLILGIFFIYFYF